VQLLTVVLDSSVDLSQAGVAGNLADKVSLALTTLFNTQTNAYQSSSGSTPAPSRRPAQSSSTLTLKLVVQGVPDSVVQNIKSIESDPSDPVTKALVGAGVPAVSVSISSSDVQKTPSYGVHVEYVMEVKTNEDLSKLERDTSVAVANTLQIDVMYVSVTATTLSNRRLMQAQQKVSLSVSILTPTQTQADTVQAKTSSTSTATLEQALVAQGVPVVANSVTVAAKPTVFSTAPAPTPSPTRKGKSGFNYVSLAYYVAPPAAGIVGIAFGVWALVTRSRRMAAARKEVDMSKVSESSASGTTSTAGSLDAEGKDRKVEGGGHQEERADAAGKEPDA